MVTKYDAVIVGGGVAGSYTAKLIAEKKNKVLLLEEHHEVGKPLQCAGLVTPRIFDFMPENGCIMNKVFGARIYSPKGNVLEIDAKKPKAVVIDRVKFDQNAMSMAVSAGSDLVLGAKALTAKYSGDIVSIKYMHHGDLQKVSTKLLIGADGVQSQVAHWFGLKRPKEILSGFGSEMTGVDLDPRFVELYLGNKVAPNFFSWAIPKANARSNGLVPARVGLACTNGSRNAYQYYHKLFSHPILGPKLVNSKPIQYVAGGIPLGLVPKSYSDHLMLVGDSAGQVKPTSGGGVYIGLLCARYCAATANQALEAKVYSAKRLKEYHRAWMDELGKELKHGYRLFKVYMHLSDDQIEEGFELLGEKSVLQIISSEGDIDYPSKISKKLFKRVPQLLKFAKPYLRSLF